jgi:hypothetical protein
MGGKYWTSDDEQYLILKAKECEFGKELIGMGHRHFRNRTRAAIKHRISELGISFDEDWTAYEKGILKGYYRKGDRQKAIKKISEMTGRSKVAVSVKLSRLGPFYGRTLKQSNGSLKRDFFDHWNSESAYIMGFTCADGWFEVKEKAKNVIGWGVHPRDIEILYAFKKILGSGLPIREYESYKKHKKYHIVKLRISSKEIIRSFQKVGIPTIKKTFRLKLPKSIPAEYLPDFIRGVFDGDGSVYCAYRINHLCLNASITGYKEFLFEIRDAVAKALEIDISYPKRVKNANKRVYRLQLSASKAVIFGKWLYSTKSKLYLSRKRKTWEEAFKYKFKRKPNKVKVK